MALVRVPFYFISFLPTSLLYISILLPQDFDMWNWGDTFLNLKTGTRAELPNVGNDEYPTEQKCAHQQ